MTYTELYKKMQHSGMVSANWRNILQLYETEYKDDQSTPDNLKLLVLYFSLIDDGNVYMSLDENRLKEKFAKKINGLIIREEDENETPSEAVTEFTDILKEIETIAASAANISSWSAVDENATGKEKTLVTDDGKLYTRKHFNAVKAINYSVRMLFTPGTPAVSGFNYKTAVRPAFSLSAGQEEIIEKGYYKNLFITGGPGTGKTTSVFFLLLSLLINNPDDYDVYLTAPSGKAASRVKESILQCESLITPAFATTHRDVLDKIKGLEDYTIHRLLGIDHTNNGFMHNENNQFNENSIFIIDEASMIDVNIFAALLKAISGESRVFILGDKNQLPSVECGAVFGELLERATLSDNIVRLTESKRFKSGSDINVLAETINADGDLTYVENKWQDVKSFTIETAPAMGTTPIYYYLDNTCKASEMIENVIKKWYETFFKAKNFMKECTDIDITDISDQEREKRLSDLWSIQEDARILCACNAGSRGIQTINKLILKEYYEKAGNKKYSGFYPGELLIVTKNNNSLDLYNGDCGVTVKFKDDDALYLMLKKGTGFNLDDKKEDNRIFKLGQYIFYPIRLISREEISSAFAITIHKSQGSDYNNIMVILPKTSGHPLLNRQIVYTAITRTKRSTYIISNQANLEEAKKTVMKRETF